MRPGTVSFVCSQIDHKLRFVVVDGQVKAVKRKSIWMLLVRHVSVAINRTASRNVQRKVTKTVNASNSTQRQATWHNAFERCDVKRSLDSKLDIRRRMGQINR